MPLSDFGFNFAAAPQEKVVFNGFGSASAKRKFEWETPPQHDMVADNECPAKRICSATHMQAADTIFQQPQEQNVAYSQLSNFSQWPLSSLQQQVDGQSVFGCLKDVTTLRHQQNLSCSTTQHTESDMVMDLCDETYSSAQHEEDLSSVGNSMDSDFVPNPEQYSADAVHTSSDVPATDKRNIIYCSTPCAGGERSPSSNTVRCFCRPVDTFLNLGPYVSDYY